MYYPSSFDAHDPLLRALPRENDWRWSSCERALRDFSSRGVIMRIPIFWQLGLPLYAACRSLGIPVFTNEPENIPVGALALEKGGLDCVVSENRDAAAFTEFLLEERLPFPKFAILIHRVHEPEWRVSETVRTHWGAVAEEVHAAPGVPILEQCAELIRANKSQFHISDKDETRSLPEYRPDFALRETALCSCGKSILERSI